MRHGPSGDDAAFDPKPGGAATCERYIALVGPTASGKSAAALAIAARHPVEIVSVDSAQVYRGLDLGTAKPGTAERAALPHHLIDIRDPADPYSAAEFAVDARRLIREINARGRLALLVGGTMLYLRALRSGLDVLPPADTRIRAELEQRARQLGWPALHAELARVDPLAAARIAPRDAQRIQRALEVWHLCGQPVSSLYASERIAGNADEDCANPVFSLEPTDRGWLHDRIAQRFDQMLDDGLLEEVRALHRRGDLDAGLPALRSVGYRQAWAVLDGQLPLSELRERGIFATRQLAKRQLTWLRSMPQRHVVAADAPDALLRLLAAVEHAIDGNTSQGGAEGA